VINSNKPQHSTKGFAMSLYHVSSICWNTNISSEEATINENALQTSEWIETPDNLSEEQLDRYVKSYLKNSTDVDVWYYNIDQI
jgi:hypothetical protein